MISDLPISGSPISGASDGTVTDELRNSQFGVDALLDTGPTVIRASQVGVEAMEDLATTVRATQFGAENLYNSQSTVRFTQFGVESLVAVNREFTDVFFIGV